VPGRTLLSDEPRQPIVLDWPDFEDMFASAHKQGEHIAIVGPNGSGKTILGLKLCVIIGDRKAKDNRPSRVCVLQYKPRDDTLQRVIPDWPIIKKWPPRYGEEHCIVWPRGGPPSTASRRERAVFAPLLDRVYQEGSQAIYIPEAAYFERSEPNGLGLSGMMEKFWGTARSLKLTVISDTQRPRHVTLLMWTEPAWLIIYQLESDDDLKVIAKHSGFPLEVYDIVPQLGEHEFLCIRRQRHAGLREIYVSKVADVARNPRKNGGSK
jgi:energy-coupling factor transporter ATP-binding protein EcfA2